MVTEGAQKQLEPSGSEAEALFNEVRASMDTLSGLLTHADDFGRDVTTSIRDSLRDVRERLDRKELRVVIVGETQSGKSTFLDALLGKRLLGLAKTLPKTITSVRRSDQYGYRARLSGGRVEVFATRFPDRTREVAKEIEDAHAASLDAQHRRYVAAADVASASDRVERAERELTDAFHALEKVRDEAARLAGHVERRERERERIGLEVERSAETLPIVLQKAPPWWTFWLWLIRLIVLIACRRDWRRHRVLAQQHAEASETLALLRRSASDAAESCANAEARLSSANQPVEEARAHLAESNGLLDQIESLRAELVRKGYHQRLDLERMRSERLRRFDTEVRALLDGSNGKDVVELEIDYPAAHLPDDIVLIDTPGMTSVDPTAQQHARTVIRERADICMIVSELERGVSGATKTFLEQLRETFPHAILVLTKMDETLASVQTDRSDPWARVEQARRIGTRRFAREVSRDPETVLSVAVAAEEALRESEHAGRSGRLFEAEVAKLFKLLRQERALVLGSWSAGVVLRCIGDVAQAEKRAEQSYLERIEALEAQRSPEPEQFRLELMARFEPTMKERATQVIASALSVLAEHAGLARVDCRQQVAACKTKDELRARAPQLATTIADKLARACREVQTHLDEQTLRAAREVVEAGFHSLRERYDLLHEVTRTSEIPIRLEVELGPPAQKVDLPVVFEQTLRSFHLTRVGFGLGGAAAGAVAGTLFLPGIGSAAGALVGAMASFAKTLGSAKGECAVITDECVARDSQEIAERVKEIEPRVAGALRASFGTALRQAIDRFARWIIEPIEAERAAIQRERDKLEHLKRHHGWLLTHDAQLASLIRAATSASVVLAQ
jgi:GTP-binding protein EngB required for normal cell division